MLFSVTMVDASARIHEKKISREFNVGANGTVQLVNKYGNVDLHTWDQSTVKIDVLITVDARKEDKAKETLDRIKVEFSESSGRVKAETEIGTIKNWKRWFGDKNDKFQIDYDVYVPKTIHLELDNRYGDVYVPSLDNDIKVTLKYGNLQIEEINGDARITMGYAKGSLASAHDATLDLNYSNLRCGTLQDVTIDSKYGQFEVASLNHLRAESNYDDYKIERAESIVNSGKYDDLILGTIGNLDVSTRYSNVSVANLGQEADLKMKYGSAKLMHVNSGFTGIDIESEYTEVHLTTDPSASFVFEAQTKYCPVRQSNLEVFHDYQRQSEITLKGFRGSRNASARIVANMTYGSLSIK